jgi:biopolymer transport protein ExbD
VRRRWFGAKARTGGLQLAALAALVDLLTLLLVFLLRAWSSDPPLVIEDASFQLPISSGESHLDSTLVVDVGTESIWVDGKQVVGTRFYEVQDEALVREVYDEVLREGGVPVALRVDGRVPYRVVRKLIYTLREAGATEVTLEAQSRAGL